MKRFTKETSIIFRMYDSGLNNKVVAMISSKGSRLTTYAKSLKSAKSKKSSSIEFGNLVSAKVIHGYNIPILGDVKVLNENRIWKKDLESINLLQMMCEVIDKFVFEEAEEPQIFEIFKETLESANGNKIFSTAIFLLKILLVTGNLPKLNESVDTGEDLAPESIFISNDQAGFVSDTSPINYGKVEERIYKTQRYMEKHGIRDILRINLTREELIKMLKLHIRWIELVIENELKSKKIIFSILK
jgi:DNA repair protein RecO